MRYPYLRLAVVLAFLLTFLWAVGSTAQGAWGSSAWAMSFLIIVLPAVAYYFFTFVKILCRQSLWQALTLACLLNMLLFLVLWLFPISQSDRPITPITIVVMGLSITIILAIMDQRTGLRYGAFGSASLFLSLAFLGYILLQPLMLFSPSALGMVLFYAAVTAVVVMAINFVVELNRRIQKDPNGPEPSKRTSLLIAAGLMTATFLVPVLFMLFYYTGL